MHQNHDLSSWLFIFPDVTNVHEQMELNWILENASPPCALLSQIDLKEDLANRFFNRIFFIENFEPSKFRLAYETVMFLIANIRTLCEIPLVQWKEAIIYVKSEVRVSLSIKRCSRKFGIRNVYSFWAFNPVRYQVLKSFNKNIKIVTRAHGGDIYHQSNYIGQSHIWPWRKNALRALDKILSVSGEGTEYLNKKHGLTNVETVYLGSRNPKRTDQIGHEKSQVIFVSVANIIPLKRLDKIAGVIKQLENPVEWHHFGDARSDKFEQDIKSQISSILANTPHRVIWHGKKEPEEIFQFYQKEQPQLFLSCSESEGIPVSIMEAMSCGLPIFTTDAGGSHELINGNGICVPIELDPTHAANWIKQNIFDRQSLEAMRMASVSHWNKRFNFNQNQEAWVKTLISVSISE